MIKNKTVLEITFNGRVYELYCDPVSPLGEVHDALSQLRATVMKMMQEADQPKEPEPCCAGVCE